MNMGNQIGRMVERLNGGERTRILAFGNKDLEFWGEALILQRLMDELEAKSK